MAYLLGPLDMVLLSTLVRIVGLSGRAFGADPSDGGAEGAEADAPRAATASSDVSYGVDGNPMIAPASSSPSSTHEATAQSSPAGASFGRPDPDPASPSSSFSQYEESEQATKVILLENNVVEDALINGSIGEIRQICYAPDQTMGQPGAEMYCVAVVHFAEGRMANIPGLMLTAFTRVKEADDLAVGTESNSLTVNDITKIGATKAYKKKRISETARDSALPTECLGPTVADPIIASGTSSTVGEPTKKCSGAHYAEAYLPGNLTTKDSSQGTRKGGDEVINSQLEKRWDSPRPAWP
ncbi:hypothetical protein THAOC_26934, partial [Thalassiosira oceanica]